MDLRSRMTFGRCRSKTWCWMAKLWCGVQTESQTSICCKLISCGVGRTGSSTASSMFCASTVVLSLLLSSSSARPPTHYSLCLCPLAPRSGPRYSGWNNIQLRGMVMTTAESTALLQQARTVLERYLFDGVDLRDDVA